MDVKKALAAAMQSMRPEETVPGWAFRFLQSIPGVTMVLPGMSNMEQLKANIAAYETNENILRHHGGVQCSPVIFMCGKFLSTPEILEQQKRCFFVLPRQEWKKAKSTIDFICKLY